MRVTKTIPPVLAALVAGLIAAFATGAVGAGAANIAFAAPEFTMPVFTIDAFFAIAVPFALLVIGAENAQATGVLMAEGYRPPVNAMTIISGIGGIAAGLLGGHNANIAGPMTAICSSEQAGENKEGRYAATVVNGVLFAAFGLVAGAAVPVVLSLPSALIGTVAGLAMIGVLLSAFQNAFGKSLGNQTGAFVALAVRHVERLAPRHQRPLLGPGRRRGRLGPGRSRKSRGETGRVSAGYHLPMSVPKSLPLRIYSVGTGAAIVAAFSAYALQSEVRERKLLTFDRPVD